MSRCCLIHTLGFSIVYFACIARAEDGNPKKQKDWGPVKNLYFVFADQAIIHVDGSDRRVVDANEMEAILRKDAEQWVIHPHMKMTRSGIGRFDDVRNQVWKIYGDLYDKQKIRGITQGSLSPRSYAYWDGIATDEDFLIDPETLRLGRVVDADGKPVKNAEAMLLPEKHVNGVYLRDGFNRDPLAEHLTHTDVLGKFRLDVWEDDAWVVVVCPQGFAATRLADHDGTINLTLKPWAKVHGVLEMKSDSEANSPKLSDFPVSMTAYPIAEISFHIYETEVTADGRFRQDYVPPGKVTVSRSFQVERGGSETFAESTLTLAPGEQREVQFGPITDEMRTRLEKGFVP